jgi:ComF family protein
MSRVQSGVVRRLTSLGAEAARLVLHSSCIACGDELPWRARTASCCDSCWRLLPRLASMKCRSCALPVSGADGVFLCVDCLREPLPLEWCDAWGAYRGSLERVLHALKFARHDFLAEPLAELLRETLAARGDVAFDAIVPVPMHRTKLRRRGYNQAELIARALAKRLGIRCELLLEKRIERTAQSTLSRDDRRANVRGAFIASPRAKQRNILIVDDVCTTGETLRACADALVRQHAAKLCAVAVAKAI